MLEKKSIGITSDTLFEFLCQIESSFSNTFREASAEEVSKLEKVAVKGFESLSFDWALCLSKYYLHSSEVHVLGWYHLRPSGTFLKPPGLITYFQ